MTVPPDMHPIIKQARDEGRVFLTEIESKELLAQAGIEVNDTRKAESKAEAVAISKKLGFPVVMKIISPDIIHKSDAGGIRLDIRTAKQVEKAYDEIVANCKKSQPQAHIQGISVQKSNAPGVELIAGMFKDPQFEQVLMFGLGGVFTEIMEDAALRITPISREDAREMIEEIKGYRLLTGFRGQASVNISKLEDILLAVSDFVEKNPEIKELDINPIIASGDSAVAVDARIILESD